MKTNPFCLECGEPISWGVYVFSQRIYGHGLCMKDQCRIEESGANGRTADLYLALKSRNFPVVLKYDDGYKQVDIAVPDMLYIEISDSCHNALNQIVSDLSHRVYSPVMNIPTVIIPKAMLENPESFERAVNEISKVCRMILKKPAITGFEFSFNTVQLQ